MSFEYGQTIRCDITIRDWDGNVLDADTTPTCKVYFEGAVVSTLTVSQTGTGKYSAKYSIPDDIEEGEYIVRWTWTISTYPDALTQMFKVYSGV